MKTSVVVSCEHAGHRVPARYRHLFAGHQGVLESHRGWDPGTLRLGKFFSWQLSAPLVATTITRLLVEPNRSPRHPALFSEFSAVLPPEERKRLVREYYVPHREKVEVLVSEEIARKHVVIHLGMHSFTPVWGAQVRRADVGLLYDPKRPGERALCSAWQAALRAGHPELVVRKNYPYRGAADGLTTYLRKRYAPERYLGVELEINQRWAGKAEYGLVLEAVCRAFSSARRELERTKF